tara:strand:+ start:12053 stop:14350 length:2298 start_codon:yes stop_codon:yes gene_type:complete
MARQATGRKVRAFPVTTTGLSENLWVEAGSVSEIDGVVFRVTGEAESAKGVRRLVDWRPASTDTWDLPQVNPFKSSTGSGGSQIDAITEFRIPKGPSELVLSEGTRILKVRNRRVDVIADNRRQPRSPGEGTSFATHGEWLYITNGADGNIKWNGDYVSPVGVAETPSPSTVSGALREDSSGSGPARKEWGISVEDLLTYTWDYRATFVNSAGQEGPASPIGSPFIPSGSGTWSGKATTAIAIVKIELPSPASPDLPWVNVYKRAADGDYYYFRTVPAGTSVIWDGDAPLVEASMGELIVEDRGQPPTCRWVQFFRGRAYYAGVKGKEAFVWYSNPGFPEEVPLFNFFDVGSSDGEPVTGMVSFSDSVIIFKETSMWQITALASGDPVLTKIDNGVGSIAPRAAMVAYDTLVFVSRQGVYGFDGSRAAPMSNKLGKLWQSVSQERVIDAVAWKDEETRRVHIALPIDNNDFLDVELVLHVANDSFSTVEGRRITAAGSYKDMLLLGVVDTNERPELVVTGLSQDMEVFSAEEALDVAGSVEVLGTPERADAGVMNSRVRFGPYDQTSVGWSHNESMEVIGVDVIMGWTVRGELDVRLYKDRENIPDTEATFNHAEPGSHQNNQEMSDLSYFPTQASELYGWGEKRWNDSVWTGRRQTRHRLMFPKAVKCREIEIEFEAKRTTIEETVVKKVGSSASDTDAVSITGSDGRDRQVFRRDGPQDMTPSRGRDAPVLTTEVVSRDKDPDPFEIHGFVLWLVAKGAERQR